MWFVDGVKLSRGLPVCLASQVDCNFCFGLSNPVITAGAGVPSCEVGVGGRWGAAGFEMLAWQRFRSALQLPGKRHQTQHSLAASLPSRNWQWICGRIVDGQFHEGPGLPPIQDHQAPGTSRRSREGSC